VKNLRKPQRRALEEKAADALDSRAIRDAIRRDAGKPKLTLDEMRARLAAKRSV
jgi:hypothetical protein